MSKLKLKHNTRSVTTTELTRVLTNLARTEKRSVTGISPNGLRSRAKAIIGESIHQGNTIRPWPDRVSRRMIEGRRPPNCRTESGSGSDFFPSSLPFNRG
ncbi:hypothetical protein AVEN_247961-1 [Araneus ventricosus]|uniref:Uncharacterized protein n=1 Tax=Araneus ventricosus TaxID=182803 RepID=A0A4Y2CI51_ARAVE|nr:hypothetical protein AVEN_247961-1 [Araneus ventricosus]